MQLPAVIVYVPLIELEAYVALNWIVSAPDTAPKATLLPLTVPVMLPLVMQGEPDMDAVPVSDDPL